MLGSLTPDIDAAFMPFGWDRYLRVHEIGTHSILGALACAVLTAGRDLAGTPRDAFHMAARRCGDRHPWPPRPRRRLRRGASACSGRSLTAHVTLPLVAMADPILLSLLVAGVIALIVAGRHRQRLAAGAALAVVGLFLSVKGMLALSALHAYESARPAETVDARVVEAGWATMRDWTVFDRTESEVRAWRVKAGSPGADLLLHWPRPRLDGLVAASTAWPTVRNFQRPARSPVGHDRRPNRRARHRAVVGPAVLLGCARQAVAR